MLPSLAKVCKPFAISSFFLKKFLPSLKGFAIVEIKPSRDLNLAGFFPLMWLPGKSRWQNLSPTTQLNLIGR